MKMKKLLQKKSVLGFVMASFFFLISVQSVEGLACENTAENSGPSTVIIEASLNENLFTGEKNCLNKECSFVLEKYSDYFYIKKHDYDFCSAATVDKNKNTISIYNQFSEESRTLRDKSTGKVSTTFNRASERSVIQMDEAGFLDALDGLIEDDISDIRQVLIQEMDRWAWAKEGNKLVITKYSQEKEKEFTDRKKQFRSCYYFDYKRVGNWLFVYTGLYDHCYFTVVRPTTCVNGTAIKPIEFFVFLLNNISMATIPYLIPYLIAIFIFGVIVYYIIRRKEFRKKLWIFLKPSVMRVMIAVVMQFLLIFILLLVGIISLETSLCLFFFSYFIVSFISYVKSREKNIK